MSTCRHLKSNIIMETNISIEQLFDSENSSIVKTKSSMALSILLIVLGIISFVISSQTTEMVNSIIPPLFIIMGIIFTAWGVLSLLFRKTLYKSADSKEKIKFDELLFDVKERDRLVRITTNGNMEELKNLKSATGDALKLRVAMAPSGDVCYTQVVTYVPFEFVNATEPYKKSKSDAQVINNLLKDKK